MKKSIIISEADNIAALMENDRVVEFFVNRGELLLGDIYVAIVENILPGIDAAFVNLGKDKMGFLHANDIPGEGALRDRLVPKQKLLVQITKEPTGHKGPRVSTAISLPGRFLVLVPEERGISISRRISESKERARLKSVVTLMKPPGVGVIIRTEAKGQNEASLFEDFEQLWDRWQTIVSEGEASIGPKLVYRDQDLLYRVIRDAYSTDVSEIIVDTADGQKRASEFMSGWAGRVTKVLHHAGDDPLLISKGIDKDIEQVLSDRADLPSGGHLNIQPTEALTVIDVNSGRFTSSRTQAETVRKTNLEAAQEIPRQLRLRNIGGMVIVDFIDMESRRDQQQVLEMFNRSLDEDRAKPQMGQMSDLGLVELTRRRQGQSLRELFAEQCPHCSGTGAVPTLTLGSGENRRVISLPNKEEDANKGGKAAQGKGPRQALRGGAQLRAASANSGRIQQSVQDFEPELEVEEDVEVTEEIDVPVEILDQMPEELLGGFQSAETRSKYGHQRDELRTAQDDESEDEEEEDEVLSTSAFTQAEAEAEEFEAEEDETPELIRAVEVSTSFQEDYAEESAELVEAEDDEPEVVVQATALPESDFETEIDPVTGVYRLKPKLQEWQTAAEVLSEDEAQSQESYYQESPEIGEPAAYAQSQHHENGHEHEAHNHEHGDDAYSHEHSHEAHSHEHGDEAHSHEHGDEAHSHEHSHGHLVHEHKHVHVSDHGHSHAHNDEDHVHDHSRSEIHAAEDDSQDSDQNGSSEEESQSIQLEIPLEESNEAENEAGESGRQEASRWTGD